MGKSTIAQPIGARLDWPAYDLNRVIVECNGTTIPIVLKSGGEASFRLGKAEGLREVSKRR